MAAVCETDQLWVPGMLLDKDYPVPSSIEMVDAWSCFLGEQALEVKGVFGVFRAAGEVAAVASIDLCEVVRESAWLVDRVYGKEPWRRSQYKKGTWVEDADQEFEGAVTMPIVQAAMNADLMEPDKDITEIADIMRNWRKNDIYIAANTSTLPGCEIATINLFLSRHLRGCFDALVLPRNHDGHGSITKAKALATLASEVGFDEAKVPLVKIDDAVHHIEGFQTAYSSHSRCAFFVPSHNDNTGASAELRTATSLEAFERADDFLKMQEVL